MPDSALATPTAKVRDLVAFTEGLRNGEPYTEADIDELVANFDRFQAVDPGTGRPYWLPYFSINHEEGKYAGLSVGDVTAVRRGTSDDGRAALIVDGDRVPGDVKQDLDTGRLRAVSVEFFDPDNPFVGPDDQPVDGKVLKSVSLLGAMSEAAKGMPAPVATFADRVKVRRFTSEPSMDRQQLIAALQALGVDVSTITDAVPDALLASMLQAAQAMQQKPQAGEEAQFRDKMKAFMDGLDADKKKAFADGMDEDMRKQLGLESMSTGSGTGGGTGAGLGNLGNPSMITMKFKDLETQAKQIEAQNQRILRFQAEQLTAAKTSKVKKFCDEMGESGQLPVAARPAIEAMLLDLDDVAVKKFADGKSHGTTLDERMAQLKATMPKVRTFGDKVPDPAGGPTPGVRQEVLDKMRARIKSTQNVPLKK